MRTAPLLSEVVELQLIDTAAKKSSGWKKKAEKPEDTAAGWLQQFIASRYATAFNENGSFAGAPIRVAAFDSRGLMKSLGMSAAAAGKPLPRDLWYAADYRDAESMLLSDKELAGVRIGDILIQLGVTAGEDSLYTPGQDAVKDAKVIFAVLRRLGLTT